jgi:hypothetical protein
MSNDRNCAMREKNDWHHCSIFMVVGMKPTPRSYLEYERANGAG